MRSFVLADIPVPLSRIALGTALYGTKVSAGDCSGIMDAFFEAGGTLIDTAHVYAEWLPGGKGASERTVGDWIARRGVRDQVVVGTKGGHPFIGSMDRSRLKPEDLASDLSESLDRLGMDCVDIYWLHRDDPAVPVGEVLDALDTLRQSGRLRAMGASNWTVARLRDADAYARRRGFADFCASQINWSLAPSVIPEAAGKGSVAMDESAFAHHCQTQLPIMAYSAQAGGFFSRLDRTLNGRDTALNRARRSAAFHLAQRHDCSANAIALAWLLNAPFPVSAIVGCNTAARLRDAMAATLVPLTDSEMSLLEHGSLQC